MIRFKRGDRVKYVPDGTFATVAEVSEDGDYIMCNNWSDDFTQLAEWIVDDFELVPNATPQQPGETVHFASGMVRDADEGKERFDLIMPEELPYDRQMLVRQARWMARGAEHYGDRNWEQATGQEELARFRASAWRHFMKWYFGVQDGDDHAAAIHFNVDGAEYVRYRLETGDEE